jgi:hypothetical protein
MELGGAYCTQASFNTMRYKGRDPTSVVGRKLSTIRPGATTVVADKSVGSMTTKGQINPTSRVSITACQAGENSQTNGLEHTIVSSILTDLVFKRSNGRRAVSSDPPLNQRSSRVRATGFKLSASTAIFFDQFVSSFARAYVLSIFEFDAD